MPVPLEKFKKICDEYDQLEKQKNQAYRERDMILAALFRYWYEAKEMRNKLL